MPAALKHTLDFLRDLRDNNSRTWFQANRTRYEAARAAFEDVVAELIQRFDVVDDIAGVTPEQTMYRINRDVRFSPDKSPYKIAMGALLAKEGRKSTGRSYYFQVMPDDQSLAAGGMYMISAGDLEKMRQAIADDDRPLRKVLEAKSFKRYFGTLHGEQLKTAPKGYPKDHHAIDLLRYKQYLADYTLTDDQVLADGLIDHLLEVYQALRPLNDYLYGVIPEPEPPMGPGGRR
jgi:uncharacterized protein (TIGR02453 family)